MTLPAALRERQLVWHRRKFGACSWISKTTSWSFLSETSRVRVECYDNEHAQKIYQTASLIIKFIMKAELNLSFSSWRLKRLPQLSEKTKMVFFCRCAVRLMAFMTRVNDWYFTWALSEVFVSADGETGPTMQTGVCISSLSVWDKTRV